jgi:putative endonuclease
MATYYVYLLRCIDGSFYTGVSNDVERRFHQHTMGHDPGSYTFSRRPLQLVYVGEFERIDEAIAFEKRLKGWTHAKKRAFAERQWLLMKRFARGRS